VLLCLVIFRLIINLRSFAVTEGERRGEKDINYRRRESKQHFDGTVKNCVKHRENVPIMIIEKYHYASLFPVRKLDRSGRYEEEGEKRSS
jgi:hypothetical protein